ncbi:hypothetical protein [Wenxinia marina]|nr:hypothetical protein [Wenxinia marina]
MPLIGLGRRPFVVALILCGALPALVTGREKMTEATEAELAALRVTDTAAYLERLAEYDPARWLTELEQLDPAGFAAEMARQAEAAEVERREAEARRAAEAREARERAEARRRSECSQTFETQAYIAAQTFVTRELRSPGSAEFPSIHRGEVSSRTLGGCGFRLAAYVDAQNAFGAVIRTRFVVELRRVPDHDAWDLVSIAFGT